MIIQRFVRAAMAGTVFAFVLAGCSSVNLDDQKAAPIVDASSTTGKPTGPDTRAVVPVDAQSARGLDPFTDPNNPLSKKSVFFDFDSFVVKSEYQPVVEAHGKYLASTKNRRITIEDMNTAKPVTATTLRPSAPRAISGRREGADRSMSPPRVALVLSQRSEDGRLVARNGDAVLIPPVAFFIPEHVPDPSLRPERPPS